MMIAHLSLSLSLTLMSDAAENWISYNSEQIETQSVHVRHIIIKLSKMIATFVAI